MYIIVLFLLILFFIFLTAKYTKEDTETTRDDFVFDFVANKFIKKEV